eukprot:TRINITY_DN11960_c0_g1_i4.p1 TRINITY_DN11960_c0_g1~~TRINITY_DN11960_c0_g1_i4.p1  ORF type:complete len:1261 (+),score=298.54 TRINITY_DN11960_c0_g1_i4:95-3784(+)
MSGPQATPDVCLAQFYPPRGGGPPRLLITSASAEPVHFTLAAQSGYSFDPAAGVIEAVGSAEIRVAALSSGAGRAGSRAAGVEVTMQCRLLTESEKAANLVAPQASGPSAPAPAAAPGSAAPAAVAFAVSSDCLADPSGRAYRLHQLRRSKLLHERRAPPRSGRGGAEGDREGHEADRAGARGGNAAPATAAGNAAAAADGSAPGASAAHPQGAQSASGSAVYRHPTAAAVPRYCTGLRNLGATCFLNGLLQAIFHLSALRDAVYKLKVGCTGRQRIGLALQRLFWSMQNGGASGVADPSELTASFRWSTNEHHQQQDVQELLLAFVFQPLQELFGECQTSADENEIHRLFYGAQRTRTKLPSVKDKQGRIFAKVGRVEEFNHIQLVVRAGGQPLRTLEASLQHARRPEVFTFTHEGCTYTDAERADVFTQLPPVMIFHLRRFVYNADGAEKLLDCFEFPVSLNMGPFTDAQGDQVDGKDWYDLHAILVHVGTSVRYGHYEAYVRLRGEERDGCGPAWWRFNDFRVTAATEGEAVQANFGGPNAGDRTAYMLMYIRHAEARRFVYSPRADRMPDCVLRATEIAAEQEQLRQQEKQRRLSCELTIFTDKELAADGLGEKLAASRFGLAALVTDVQSLFGDRAKLAAARLTVLRTDSLDHVYQEAAKQLRLSEAEQRSLRLWVCSATAQLPLRPTKRLRRGDAEVAKELGEGETYIKCPIFAEWGDTRGEDEPMLVLVREYHRQTNTLRYSGCQAPQSGATYGTVCETLLPPSSHGKFKSIWRPVWRLSGIGGVTADAVPLMADAAVEGAVQLIVCQCSDTPEAKRWLQDRRPEHVDCLPAPVELSGSKRPSFVDFLVRQQSFMVGVLPRQGRGSGSKTLLFRSWQQHQIHRRIAEVLGCSPAHLHLWVSKAEDQTLAALKVPAHGNASVPHIYYEVVTGAPDEVHSAMLDVRDAGGKRLETRIICLPPVAECRMRHLFDSVALRWPELGAAESINMIEVCDHAITAVFGTTTREDATPWAVSGSEWAWRTKCTYRVEPKQRPVPECAHGTSRVISVCHYWRPQGTPGTIDIIPFGEPFRVAILESDTAVEVLQRVRKHLGLCAEPAPLPATSAQQRAGGAALFTSPWKLRHIAPTSDEEERQFIERARMMSLEKGTSHADPNDDGGNWQVAVLSKDTLAAEWAEGSRLGEGEAVWTRLQNPFVHQVTVGVQHAPPVAPETSAAGVVVRSD